MGYSFCGHFLSILLHFWEKPKQKVKKVSLLAKRGEKSYNELISKFE